MRRLLPLVALVAALVLSGCSSVRSYAAIVNGERISQGELESELEAILANEEYLSQIQENFQGEAGEGAVGAGRNTFTTAFVAALLDRQIGFELIDQELRRRRLTVSDADRAAAKTNLDGTFGPEVLKAFPASYVARLTRDFAKVATLERALADTTVTDDDVRQFYETNAALFKDQSCSRHILVDTAESATAIRARIEAGEDFAAIARAESTDRAGADGGSAAAGGDLGCQARGTFVPEFQTALDALAPGQVSDPVQTQFGFHVIKLDERKDIALAEASARIRRQLEQQAGEQGAVGRFVNEAVAKADVKVNPRYGSFSTGDSPGVKAPPAVGGPAPGIRLPVAPG